MALTTIEYDETPSIELDGSFCNVDYADNAFDSLPDGDIWQALEEDEKENLLRKATVTFISLLGSRVSEIEAVNLKMATAVQALHIYRHQAAFEELEKDGIASVTSKSMGSSSVTRSTGSFSLKKTVAPLAKYYLGLGNSIAMKRA